jgi:hypothetical protein
MASVRGITRATDGICVSDQIQWWYLPSQHFPHCILMPLVKLLLKTVNRGDCEGRKCEAPNMMIPIRSAESASSRISGSSSNANE